uniref:Golgi associated RAB2 interactor protein-like Rab2B-binding domain-containing protein n=1 Tax=Chelonoidis abingdonii TaxID=106734 RepID=A0A8C0H6S4_CHEAB
ILRRSLHPFPECISDFAFAGWIPVIGELQKLLVRGEYNPLCPAPLFESNFLQVTKQGERVDLHNRASLVTLGIAATSPALLLPDVMIIARPMERPQGELLGPKGAHVRPGLELTRLIPLELVSIFLHDLGEQQLKLRLATGRVYYLQLCAPRGEERPLFARWLRLIYLLRAPPDSWASVPSWHTTDLAGGWEPGLLGSGCAHGEGSLEGQGLGRRGKIREGLGEPCMWDPSRARGCPCHPSSPTGWAVLIWALSLQAKRRGTGVQMPHITQHR